MSGATRIEWTEVTWNPTTGCDRISPGCDNCYALKLAKRLKAMGQRNASGMVIRGPAAPGGACSVRPRYRSPNTAAMSSASYFADHRADSVGRW
ncbi:DUF5131 family protein [Streptomyces sp. NPDC002755]